MRKRLMKKKSMKIGLPPGSLIYVGDKTGEAVTLTVFEYTPDHLEERRLVNVEECLAYREKTSIFWIDVDATQRVEVVKRLGDCFEIHPLNQEDILNTDQRPKYEDHGNYLFIVLKMLSASESGIVIEQVSLVLGTNFLISFQEAGKKGDVFEPVRERLREGKGRIRGLGADFLAYSIIDAVVDNYFVILEQVGEKIEYLEDELVGSPAPETLRKIHELKREMIFLRKSVWPLREVINGLERRVSPLVKETTLHYLRDVYDHTIQIIDAVETFRDMLSGMLDIYLSSISNRTNEVMKVLTIIATIFIPLTFIVGVYGMNFRYMPELDWRWGYFFIWIINIVVAAIMLVYFRRRKWL